MRVWAKFQRDGELPFDVINLHHYSNDAGGQAAQPTVGISPEADGLRERFQAVSRWREDHHPELELWVSEFGYDTNPKSVQRAPAIGDTRLTKFKPADWFDRFWNSPVPASIVRKCTCSAT